SVVSITPPFFSDFYIHSHLSTPSFHSFPTRRASNLYLLSSLQDEQFLHHTLYLLYLHKFFLLSESQKSSVYHAYQNKWLVEVEILLEKILDAFLLLAAMFSLSWNDSILLIHPPKGHLH